MDYERPTEEFLLSIDIHTILPQQEPFVMIGALTHFEMSHIVTELVIPEDNIFVQDGRFCVAGLIENVAQTCAARTGYINKYILHRGVDIGYIAAIREMDVMELPRVDERITTEMWVREEVFGMILADAVVRCGDRILMKIEFKVSE